MELSGTQSIPFVGKTRGDGACSCPSAAVHASTPRSLFYRLSYLFRHICGQDGRKHTIESRQNTRGKQAKQYTQQANISLFQKSHEFTLDRPRSNCLFRSVDHTTIPCCCRFFVGLANSLRAAACCVVVSLLSSIPMFG